MKKIKRALLKALMMLLIIASGTFLLLSIVAVLTYCLSPQWATISSITIILLLLFIVFFICEYKYN